MTSQPLDEYQILHQRVSRYDF